MLAWGCLRAEESPSARAREGTGVKARESLGVKASRTLSATRESLITRLSLMVLVRNPEWRVLREGGRDVPPQVPGTTSGTHRLWTHARVFRSFVCREE